MIGQGERELAGLGRKAAGFLDEGQVGVFEILFYEIRGGASVLYKKRRQVHQGRKRVCC